MRPLLLSFLALSIGGSAYAFPSNTRYGYANCSSCHVSPTGGGVLNSYGHMSAEELLSSFSSPHESEATFGALHSYGSVADNYVRVGADVRYLSLRTASKTQPLHVEDFWMQREGEVAVSLTKELTLVGTVGYYALGNDLYQVQSRQDYALVNMNDYVSLRVGKFFPAYGLLVEDHTVATRSGLGWDQGQETYNIEMSLKNSMGDFFLTYLVAGTTSSRYAFTPTKSGVAGRLTGYVGSSSQIGISGLYYQLLSPGGGYQAYYGAFGVLGFTPSLYLLGEIDGVTTVNPKIKNEMYSYSMLGFEVSKGVHLQTAYQVADRVKKYDFRIQWFPRPHYEIVGSVGQTTNALIVEMLLHYYL